MMVVLQRYVCINIYLCVRTTLLYLFAQFHHEVALYTRGLHVLTEGRLVLSSAEGREQESIADLVRRVKVSRVLNESKPVRQGWFTHEIACVNCP